MTGATSRSQSRMRGSSDVYTVLMLVAVLSLLAGVVYVWAQLAGLPGGANPFNVPASAAAIGQQLASAFG